MASYPPHYDAHAAAMREMVEAGMKTSQIARAMGLSPTTVRRIKAVCLIEETADRRRYCRDPWADMKVALAQIEKPKPSPEEVARAAHDRFVEDLRKYHPEREKR